MRYVKIDNLLPGMVLGEGLKNPTGKIYVQAGEKLTSSYIERLKKEGYTGLFIEDNISAEVEIAERFDPYRYSLGSDCLASRNVNEMTKIATNIVDDVVRRHPKRISIHSIQPFDDYIFCHSINVAIYSTVIGLELGLDRQGLYLLATAAMMHDIGMTYIPKALCEKKGALTGEERGILERHVLQSATFLKEEGVNILIIKAVIAHHENENGTGYPNRLTGDKIPDFAKIIHVADVLDAMTTKRPYKEAFAVADVLDYISSGSGILYHPEVAKAALKRFDAYPIGSEVTWANGLRGIVCGRTENNFKPVVIIPDSGKKIELDENSKDQYLAEQSKEKAPAGRDSQPAGVPDKESETVVVVDDTYVFRRTMEVALNSLYHVVSFDNAPEALSFIIRNKVDLVLMDIEMPGMDGLTAVQKLRTSGFKDLPVIFLTSVNDRSVVVKCLSMGAADYVLKPVKQIYVQERVAEALKKHH